MSENNENLNETFEEEMDDATVITVPIDATLSNSGEAADAKAVGDALALKADISQLSAAITVDGQSADNQGAILLYGSHIPVSSGDSTKLDAKLEAIDAKTAADIKMASDDNTTIAQAIAASQNVLAEDVLMEEGGTDTVADELARLENEKGKVKSVNGRTPNSSGNVSVEEVGYARNLVSDAARASVGSFVERTAGGESSISDGTAFLQQIRGNMSHAGYVAESIDMTVTAAESGITATIDRDTFVGAVSQSGTTTLSYTTSWSADPATYGVTVTGTPESGDSIVIVYVKEERGTITPARPETFVATGWNLYKNSNGYAKVVKYNFKYHVGGTYTSLSYSATPGGTQQAITVVDGSFDVPADGYVHVTGGNGTDTYITLEWQDWTEGPTVAWAAYSESMVDLSDLFDSEAIFENGLLAVGTTYDVIDLELGQAISRIERQAYNSTNLAAAKASGRAYEYDENYIYIVRATPVTEDISAMDGQFTACDHGIEFITETEVPVTALILYGSNLKNKLERDVLTISEQALTTVQKAQVLTNIGADKFAKVNVLSSINSLDALKNALDAINTALTDCEVYTFRFTPTVTFDQFFASSAYYGVLYRYSTNTFNCNIICGYKQQNIIIARYSSGWKFTETIGKGKGTYEINFNEQFAGYITSDATNLHMFVPVTPNPTVTNVAVSITKITARGVTGYVANALTDFTGITISKGLRPDGFNVLFSKASGTWGTNNTPVVIQAEGTYTLS